jgi:acyl-CoA synthetase (AMP-forming)/AMP-acid ligase II
VVSERGTTYPLCCEPVFNAHPAVERSALVGVTEGGGTHPVICVELSPPGDAAINRAQIESGLLTLARSHRSTELVERVHFLDRLPVDRRHNAKIDRPRIAADLSSPRPGRGRP